MLRIPFERRFETSGRMDTEPIFSFILVNYNSAKHLPACFSSFSNISIPGNFEIIVANNDSREEKTLQDLQKKFPFSFFSLPKNRGFGFASNRAAERARGTILVFLNPDARFLSGDMGSIRKILTSSSSVGIIGFHLLLEPEKTQKWNAGKQSTLLDTLRNNIGIPAGSKFRLKRNFASQDIAWVSGAAFATTRNLFFSLQGFDERFFLYYEDVDFCVQVKKQRKNIVISPDIRVLHMGSGSVSFSNRKQKNTYFKSQDRYFLKHRPFYEYLLLKFLKRIMNL